MENVNNRPFFLLKRFGAFWRMNTVTSRCFMVSLHTFFPRGIDLFYKDEGLLYLSVADSSLRAYPFLFEIREESPDQLWLTLGALKEIPREMSGLILDVIYNINGEEKSTRLVFLR